MKHDTKKYPDLSVKEKVVKSPKEVTCSHCQSEVENKDKRDTYMYDLECPHCLKEIQVTSRTPAIQFLVVCTCQTEFNCYCMKNLREFNKRNEVKDV